MLKNFEKMLQGTKTRTVLLLFLVIVIVAFAIAITSGDKVTDDLSTSKTLAAPTNIKAIPGGKTTEKYRELQEVDNQQRVEEALKTDKSAIPTILHSDEVKADKNKGFVDLTGDEIVHGVSPFGPYGARPDQSEFGIGPNGKPYDMHGYDIHGFGPNGPYGIGPDGKPFGIGPDGKPYDPNGPYGPNGDKFDINNEAGYQIHGYGPYGPYGVGPDGKPFGIGPDGNPYDPNSAYAPAWYEPTKYDHPSSAQARLAQQKEELKALQDKRAADVKAREAELQAEREAELKRRAEESRAQAQEKLMKERMNNMSAMASSLFDKWSDMPTQQYVSGNPLEDATVSTVSDTGTTAGTFRAARPGDTTLRAGDIIFATIDSAINSDQPGPILATVVHGPMKGGRLVGKFSEKISLRQEGLTLNFNRLSLPKAPQSISLSAVAIDPDTARTAIASDVDHHYLLRYGTLFASAFLEGYGKVIKEAGAAKTDNTDGSTTTSTASLNGREELFAAFGNVGEKVGAQTAPYFSRPPTITIESGTSIGILILDDINITAALESGR